MNQRSLMHQDIDMIISNLDIQQYDLQIELKDHLLCMIEDKMDDDPELHYADAILMSRYEIKALIRDIMNTINEDRRQDVFDLIRESVTGHNFLIAISIAVIAFVIYNGMGFLHAPHYPFGAMFAVMTYLSLRWRIRRLRPDMSYSNKALIRASSIPIILGTATLFGFAYTAEFIHDILRSWGMRSLYILPMGIVSLGWGFFIKILIDTRSKVPFLLDQQSRVDQALKRIGYRVSE